MPAVSPEIIIRRQKVADMDKEGLSTEQIAEKLGVTKSLVFNDRFTMKKNGSVIKVKRDSSEKETVLRLKSEGYKATEIAEKTGLTKGQVHHFYYYKGGSNGSSKTATVHTNGSTSVSVNHDEEAKIAYIYGSIQRELDHLIERAALPRTSTTQRLAKLILSQTHR